MNPFVLYLFFTLDNFRTAADVFLFITSVAFIVGLLAFCIGYLAQRDEGYTYDGVRIPRANEWCARFKKVWGWWGRVLVPIFCVSLAIIVAVPNTKQAIAIYVIPRVVEAAANNEDLMALPQDVVEVARAYLKKVMTEWAQEVEEKATGAATEPAEETGSESDADPADKGATALEKAKKALRAAEDAVETAEELLK